MKSNAACRERHRQEMESVVFSCDHLRRGQSRRSDWLKALARIAKICRENIAAFGPGYDPRWPLGGSMKGAKAEGNGVTDMAREILVEIKSIRREHRQRERGTTGVTWGKGDDGGYMRETTRLAYVELLSPPVSGPDAPSEKIDGIEHQRGIEL